MLLPTIFFAAMTAANPIDALPCGSMPAAQVEHMDYLAFFADQASAEVAAREIDESLFDVSVRTAASKEDWVLRAVYRKLPTPEAHARNAVRVQSVVDSQGGRLGGFGCQSGLLTRAAR